MDEVFMRRPTEVLVSYMAAEGRDPKRVKRLLYPGRIAMALEIMTLIRLLEDHQLMTEYEGMISCLQTLLVDQELAEDAAEWYENLNEWRKPKFAAYEHVAVVRDVRPSERGGPQVALPPPRSTDAPHGSDQTKDPPCTD